MSLPLAGFIPPDRGVLFVVSGPSGVGKSTLVRYAMEQIESLSFSVSATTRAPRQGEEDGVHYHFLDPKQFEGLVSDGAFLEHATVYDQQYGTLAAPTEEALASGRSVLLDIDVVGARQVLEVQPDAVWVFIAPPSIGALRARLEARGTDSAEIIDARMKQLGPQLEGVRDAHYVVVNDDLEAAKVTMCSVLLAALCRVSQRQPSINKLLSGAG